VQYSKNKQHWDGNALKAALENCIAQEKIKRQGKHEAPKAFASLNP
jgi:hypothetical protein